MPVGKQRVLAAFLPRNELLQQVQVLSAVPNPQEMVAFWAGYKAARAAFGTLQPAPTGPPQLLPLDPGSDAHISRVEGTTAFQEAFGGTGYSFLKVPIDRLTSVQIFCNVDPPLPPPSPVSNAAILEYALPPDPTVPAEVSVTPSGFKFLSTRYGLGPSNLKRRIRDGAATFSFEHVNLVQVRKFGNQLILFNGTHRALEMHLAGHAHIPALVIEHRDSGEVEWPTGPGFWNVPFLLGNPRQAAHGARPPVIPDFHSNLSVEYRVMLSPSVIDLNLGGPQVVPQVQLQQVPIRLGGVIPVQGP